MGGSLFPSESTTLRLSQWFSKADSERDVSAPSVDATPAPGMATGRQGAAATGGAALLGVMAAAVYVLIPRSTLHGYDPYWLLPRMVAGNFDYPLHPLSLHAMHLLDQLLVSWGGDLEQRLRIASGLGTGLAVAFFTHAAWLMTADCRRAGAVGVLFACLPATVHFATVMELHAIFLPAMAAVVWFACWGLSRPARLSFLAGSVLGAMSSFATALHSTGNLAVPFLAAWISLELRQAGVPWRRLVGFVVAFGMSHLLGGAIVQWLATRDGSPSPTSAQLGFLSDSMHGLGDWHQIVLGEWVVPYAPVAVVCWFAGRGTAPMRVCLVCALIVHMAVCATLLVLPMGGYVLREFGAYQQTLAFFATVLAVQAASRFWYFLLPLALLATSSLWWMPAKEPPDRLFGETALEHMANSGDRLLVGCFAEYDGIFRLAWSDSQRAPLLKRMIGVDQLLVEVMQGPPCTAIQLAGLFHPDVARAPTVVTQMAFDQLRAAGGIFREFVDVALPAVFTLQEVSIVGRQGGVLRGVRLDPKRP